MIVPPLLLHIERRRLGRRAYKLWIPVILSWPLIVLIVLIALIVLAVRCLLWPNRSARRRLAMSVKLLWLLYPLTSALRGAHLRYEDEQGKLLVELF